MHRTTSDEAARYELFVKVLKDSISPVESKVDTISAQVQQVMNTAASKTELADLRMDINRRLDATYSREVADGKFAMLNTAVSDSRNLINDMENEIRDAKRMAVSDKERNWTRVGLVASVGYILLQSLPHLLKGFGQ